jgi:hypothetical protein
VIFKISDGVPNFELALLSEANLVRGRGVGVCRVGKMW